MGQAQGWTAGPAPADAWTKGAAPTDFGTRADGSPKGKGFLGVLKRPDGSVSSEISIGVNIDGKEVEIPTLVPTLSKSERDWLVNNDISDPSKIPSSIVSKATSFARTRIKAGQSPFASDNESPKAAAPSDPSLVKRYLDKVNPIAAAQSFGRAVIPEAMARALGANDAEAKQYGPMNTLHNIGAAQQDVFNQAKEAYDKGDYGSAAIKAMFGMMPIVGPEFNQMGDNARAGKWGEALTDVAAMGTNIAMPAVAGKVTANVGKVLPAARTAEEAAAVDFGRANDVPIDAATATGNRYVQGMQAMADRSPIGSVVAGRAGNAQAQAMRRVAGDLKNQASPVAVDPVVAGERVAKALETKIQRHHAEATAAYDKLRDFEQNATPDMVRAKNTGAGADDFNDMQLAVDLRSSKPQFQPILNQLLKKKELTGQLQGAEGRAAVALDSLVNGPDFAPLSVVDSALSDIKGMARGADMPELRTSGQGIAAEVVKRLDAQVRARASRAGSDVLKALDDGRAATKAKYATADARDLLVPASGEPRRVFNSLTANEDAGITKLRELQKVAPQELPTVARALLDDLFTKPMEEGGFSRGLSTFNDWQRLGSQTKKLLFPKPGQTQSLDSFFLLAKKLSESPNPSGTALTANSMGQTVLAFTNPSVGVPVVIGSGALSKILHSPKAVDFLTRGLRLSVDTKPGTTAVAASQFVRAAKEAGVVIQMPKAAETQEPQQ